MKSFAELVGFLAHQKIKRRLQKAFKRKPTVKIPGTPENWENRKLGADEEFAVPADADFVAADLHYLHLKQSGELQRRQDDRNMRAQIQENLRNENMHQRQTN
jgi:hypothetical protein